MAMDDLVDIIDDDGNVLEQLSKAEAIAQGKRFRVVGVLLINSDDEILVQWRAYDKELHPRLFTYSAAGTVNAGEDVETAAKRELQEELGVDVALKQIAAFNVENPAEQVVLYVGDYEGEVTGWEEEADVIDYWDAGVAEFMLARFPYLLTPGMHRALEILFERMEAHDEPEV